jgi:hypothetical protein
MTAAAFAAVHRLPWQARRARRTLAWGMAALLAVAVLLTLRDGLAPMKAAGVLALVVATGWWWWLVDGLRAQNQPALARLLPGQLTALRLSLLGHALLSGAVAVGGASLLVGPRAEVAARVILGLIASAWLQRQPWLWVPIGLLPVSPWSLRAIVLQVVEAPLPAQAVAGAAAALVLLAVLGGGGRAHRRSAARHQRWKAGEQASKEGRGVPISARWPGVRRLAMPFIWPEHLAWRRMLAHPHPGNLLRRLDLTLQTGGGTPMLAWLLLLCFGGALLALAVAQAWRPAIAWDQVVHGGRFGLCMGLFGVLVGAPMGRLGALWGRRREQALLVLLPGPPSGPALAAALERHWQRDHVALWALGTALVLAIAAQGQPGTPAFVAAFAAACLPLGAWMQGRWRVLRGQPALAIPALTIVVLGFSAAAGARALDVPAAVSLALGLLAYVLLRLRARQPAQAVLPTHRAPT